MGELVMRLWHYKLIPFLPNSQLLAQWRELNSIFKKQDKHILINYVYEYPKESLCLYADLIINEMANRDFEIRSFHNYSNYFGSDIKHFDLLSNLNPFPKHHNDRYLKQCFYNLQEKFDRGQKDFEFHQIFRMAQLMNERGLI